MTNRSLLFTSLALSLFLNACSLNPFGRDQGVIKVDNDWHPKQMQLKCGIQSGKKECDGSVGLLMFVKRGLLGQRFVSRCTAWLRKADKILANMHCVDNRIYGKKNVPVEDTYFVLVNDSKSPKKLFKVTSLIKGHRHRFHNNVDYAYFQLESPVKNVSPIEIDRSTPKLNGRYKVVSVNRHAKFGRDGSRELFLDTYRCFASDKNVIVESILTPQSQNLVLYNCPIIGGNSGSPILTGQNKAIGIIHANFILNEKNKKLFFQHLETHYPKMADMSRTYTTRNFGLGGLFQCIPDLEDSASPFVAPECEIKTEQEQLTQKAFSGRNYDPFIHAHILRAAQKSMLLTNLGFSLHKGEWKVTYKQSGSDSPNKKHLFQVILFPTCKTLLDVADSLDLPAFEVQMRISVSSDLRLEVFVKDSKRGPLKEVPPCI